MLGSFLLELGAVAAAITIILGCIAAVSRLPPVRWLWRQLISGPLERFSTRIVREGAGQFHAEVVEPQITAIAADVSELRAQSETSWHKDKGWIDRRIVRLEERQKQLIVGISTALSIAEDGEDVRDLIVGVLSAMLDEERPPKGEVTG